MKSTLFRFAVVTLAALIALPGAASASLESFDATDMELATEFVRLLKEDVAGLDAFLAPDFLLQRSDGSYLGKEAYLRNPARVDDYVVTDVVGRRVGNVRVIRSTLAVLESIDGVWVSSDPMPRLSTFIWNGERWQLLAHANFVAIPHTAGSQ